MICRKATVAINVSAVMLSDTNFLPSRCQSLSFRAQNWGFCALWMWDAAQVLAVTIAVAVALTVAKVLALTRILAADLAADLAAELAVDMAEDLAAGLALDMAAGLSRVLA